MKYKALLLAGFITAHPAIADAQNLSAEAVAATSDSGLSDIVVTAQKRSENIQRVPIAITALSGDQLRAQHVTNINAIGAQVPSLTVASPYADSIPLFSLRGISTLDISQNQSSPVAVYVDEVYKGLGLLSSLQVFDLDRVEVLRGPQGTLYGKNTTGGAVNFYTIKPDLNAGYTGYLSVGIGNFNRYESSGAINVPIVPGLLAARGAFTYARERGFVKNLIGADQNSINDLAGRLSIEFKPNDRLNFIFRYTQSRSRPTGYGLLAEDIVPNVGVAGFGYTRSGLGFFENESELVGFQRLRNRSLALTAVWDVADSVSLTSVTGYDGGQWRVEEDTDATPLNLIQSDYFSRARAFQQDLRLSSRGNGPLKWLLGAYYYRDSVQADVNLRFFYGFAGDNNGNGQLDCFDDGFTGCSYRNELRQIRKSYALYTQQSYAITDRVAVVAGLRYTHDNIALDYYRSFLSYLDPATGQEVRDFAAIIVAPPPGRDHRTNQNISGKIGANFQITPQTLVYASLSRGYRGAAFNGQGIFSADEITVADPERLDSLEMGLKTQLHENRLRINTAIFYYDYRNQQYLNTDTSSGAPLQVLYNAPRSRLWGGEVEVSAKPIDVIDVHLGGSYLNSKYRKATLLGINVAGNQLILAPKWTFNAAVDWKVIDRDIAVLSLHGDMRYTSAQFYDAFNDPAVSQPNYAIFNASATLGLSDNDLKLTGWIKNIANRKYRVIEINAQQSFFTNLAQRGRAREFGVTAAYSF